LKNERLVEFDELFGADEVALGCGQAAAFHIKGNGDAIDCER